MHAQANTFPRLVKTLCAALVAIFLALPLTASAAGGASPVGTWQTIDDETGKAKAVVKVYERKGKLYGKIIKLNQKKVETPLCHKCSGSKKDKPIEGMVIMWGLEHDEGSSWDDGRILIYEDSLCIYLDFPLGIFLLVIFLRFLLFILLLIILTLLDNLCI